MKLIKDSERGKVFRDHDQVLKVKNGPEAAWEAHILTLLSGIPGIPEYRGMTDVIGGHPGVQTLVMDLMPGTPLSEAIPPVRASTILSQLETIITKMYLRSVCHTRITPEHVLCTEHGQVALVGFAAATVFESAPMEYFSANPDLVGEVFPLLAMSGYCQPPGSVIGSWREIGTHLARGTVS